MFIYKDQLPSNLQPGDYCSVDFGKSGFIKMALVTKVSFSIGSITYDVSVPFSKNGEEIQVEDGVPQNVGSWIKIHGIKATYVNKLGDKE